MPCKACSIFIKEVGSVGEGMEVTKSPRVARTNLNESYYGENLVRVFARNINLSTNCNGSEPTVSCCSNPATMSRIGHVQRLKLQSYDNKVFEVDRKVACVSKLIQEFLEEPHTKVVAPEVKIIIDIIEDTTRKHAPIVCLPRIDGEALWKVLEYSKAYVEGAKNASSAHKNDEEEEKMVPWEIESFFKMDQVTFTSLLRAGAYLQTEGLVALACRAAVHMADRGMDFDKGEGSTGISSTI